MKNMMRSSFFRFALVGAGGFVVDAGVLLALLEVLGPYWGRLVSFAAAVTATWALNRSFTFSRATRAYSLAGEFSRYVSAMLLGGAVNYAVYAAMIYLFEPVRAWPVVGVGAGSIAGLLVNFTLARSWIFKERA